LPNASPVTHSDVQRPTEAQAQPLVEENGIKLVSGQQSENMPVWLMGFAQKGVFGRVELLLFG